MNCEKCKGLMLIHNAIECSIFGRGWERGAGWTCERCDHYKPYSKALDNRVLKDAS